MKNLPEIPNGFVIAGKEELITSSFHWGFPGGADWQRTKYPGEKQPANNVYIRPRKENENEEVSG